jgi:hypothetical protein
MPAMGMTTTGPGRPWFRSTSRQPYRRIDCKPFFRPRHRLMKAASAAVVLFSRSKILIASGVQLVRDLISREAIDASNAARFNVSAQSTGGFDRFPPYVYPDLPLNKRPKWTILASQRPRLREYRLN